MTWIIGLVAAVVVATPIVAAPRPEPPGDERLPHLAEQLVELLRDSSVIVPDGTEVPVIGALLDLRRIEACLATLGAADAWPEAWLVVQVEALEFDLVLPIRLGGDGKIEDPDPVFAAARREWSVDALREAIREATGRKPKGRTWNVVVQGFRARIEQRYVYDLPADRRGLLGLLPEGTLLREAKLVELADGRRYTLALVMQEAEFVPSSCGDCESRALGHVDTGRILVVLADEMGVEDEIDLSSIVGTGDDRVLLPRYSCEGRDVEDSQRELPIEQRFAGRKLVTLIRLRDLDGDGHEMEFELIARVEGCKARSVVFGIGPTEARLRVVGE